MPQTGLPIPSYTLVHATTDPAQYRSALPRDVTAPQKPGPEASGEACRTMITFPPEPPTPFLGSASVASLIPWPSVDATWGNDGYAKAVAKAVDGVGGGTLIDVRTDVHTTAILGIWRKECIEVHGRLAR
jgi:hypothetical protein